MLHVDESKSSQCFELGSQVPIPESPCFLGPLTNANVSTGGLGELPSSVNGRLNGKRRSPRRGLDNLNTRLLLLQSKVLDGERPEEGDVIVHVGGGLGQVHIFQMQSPCW